VTAWYAGQEGTEFVVIGSVVWLQPHHRTNHNELSSLMTGIPSSHLHRLIIPDDVLIQFDLLMMSIVMLETCREMK